MPLKSSKRERLDTKKSEAVEGIDKIDILTSQYSATDGNDPDTCTEDEFGK